MPIARKIRNVRQTKQPKKQAIKRRKQDGRPKGTFKKFKFEETKLGFLLKYETPLEYELIINSIPFNPFPEPPIEVIEIVTRASKDPTFKKGKFFRYLEEYRIHGLCCRRAKKLTPERMFYYESIRDKKMELFIKRNIQRINYMKKKHAIK